MFGRRGAASALFPPASLTDEQEIRSCEPWRTRLRSSPSPRSRATCRRGARARSIRLSRWPPN